MEVIYFFICNLEVEVWRLTFFEETSIDTHIRNSYSLTYANSLTLLHLPIGFVFDFSRKKKEKKGKIVCVPIPTWMRACLSYIDHGYVFGMSNKLYELVSYWTYMQPNEHNTCKEGAIIGYNIHNSCTHLWEKLFHFP